MFISANFASQAMKKASTQSNSGPVAAAPSQPAPAQVRTDPGAVTLAPNAYARASAANPFSQMQSFVPGSAGNAAGTGAPALSAMRVADASGAKAKRLAEARALAADPKKAAENPKEATQMIRTLPPGEQMAFAHKMLGNKQIPADRQFELLQKLTEPGARGVKSAVTLDKLARSFHAPTNLALAELVSDINVGGKMAKLVGNSASPDTHKLLGRILAGDQNEVGLSNLLAGASKAGLNGIVGEATQKGQSPTNTETLAKAVWGMSQAERKAMTKGLSRENLMATANAAIDYLNPAPSALGSGAAKTVADLVKGMKPRDRNDFLRAAYDTPGRGDKLERLAKDSPGLVDPALTFGN
jgi:hypothetical protein